MLDAAVAYFSAGQKTIAADALYENLNDGDASNDPYVISVRQPEDYAAGHIQHGEHQPRRRVQPGGAGNVAH